MCGCAGWCVWGKLRVPEVFCVAGRNWLVKYDISPTSGCTSRTNYLGIFSYKNIYSVLNGTGCFRASLCIFFKGLSHF